MAYDSDESGRVEVYVRPFPNVESARRQVSTGGGTRPLWSRTGREIFYYVAPDTIMAVPVRVGADVTLGSPRPVVKGSFAAPIFPNRHYDVSADGQRSCSSRMRRRRRRRPRRKSIWFSTGSLS